MGVTFPKSPESVVTMETTSTLLPMIYIVMNYNLSDHSPNEVLMNFLVLVVPIMQTVDEESLPYGRRMEM